MNAYAVRDRVDLSSYCTTEATNTESVVSVESLLPNENDRKCIMANFVLLAARIMCESIPALQEIPDLAMNHMLHVHSAEMNSRSEIVREPFKHGLLIDYCSITDHLWFFFQVPLGIIMKNENKTGDMVDILSHLHQYASMNVVNVPDTGARECIPSERMHHLLIGGDQLTAERVRGAQSIRKNSTHAAGRLEGYIPICEDWHAKVCFLMVRHCIFHDSSTLFDASNLKGVVEMTLQEGRHFHRAMYNATPAVTDQPEQCASKSQN